MRNDRMGMRNWFIIYLWILVFFPGVSYSVYGTVGGNECLANDGSYIPIILYKGGNIVELNDDACEALLKIGITPWVPLSLDEKQLLNQCRRLQLLNSPVLLMDFRGGLWPYGNQWSNGCRGELNPDTESESNVTYLIGREPWLPVRSQLKTKLIFLLKNGIDVKAVWVDWEGYPFRMSIEDYRQQLKDFEKIELTFLEASIHKTQRWYEYLSTYFGSAAQEVYPGISLCAWSYVLSSSERPTQLWNNRESQLFCLNAINTTNPVAYGNSEFFSSHWPMKHWPKQKTMIDAAYTHLLLRQVSQDSWNRMGRVPYLKSVPWVARVVKDDSNPEIPTMSHDAYRDCLIHLWLRGISGMMVFNKEHSNDNNISENNGEVDDALFVLKQVQEKVGNEMILNGEILNLSYPAVPEREANDFNNAWKMKEPVFWSGLRYRGRIVIRVTNLGTTSVRQFISIGEKKYGPVFVNPGGVWVVFED